MRFAAAMVAAICLCRLSASDGKRWWKRPDSWWTWDEWKRYWTYDRLVDYLGDPTEWFFVFAFDAALAAFLLFHFLPFTKNRITTTPSSDSRSSRMIRRRPALGISTKDAGHLLDVISHIISLHRCSLKIPLFHPPQIIATSDKEGCFTKYVCHLSGREPAKRTPATSSFVAFLQ